MAGQAPQNHTEVEKKQTREMRGTQSSSDGEVQRLRGDNSIPLVQRPLGTATELGHVLSTLQPHTAGLGGTGEGSGKLKRLSGG